MSDHVFTIDPDDDLERAARRMYVHRVGCLPVVDGRTLIGIITESDVFRAMVEVFGIREQGVRLVLGLGGHAPPLWEQLRELEVDGFELLNLSVYRPGAGEATQAVLCARRPTSPGDTAAEAHDPPKSAGAEEGTGPTG